MDQEGAEAPVEAASEAAASEAAVDLAVEDTAEADLAVAREAQEVRISVGDLALALVAGIADRIITAVAVSAV